MPGITGALAAGMTVLGFHGGSHCRPGHADTLRAAGAAMTFDDMRQLPGLIAQIENPPLRIDLANLSVARIPAWSENPMRCLGIDTGTHAPNAGFSAP